MKIIAVGMNYAEHNKELNDSLSLQDPVIFSKPESAVIRENKPFFVPDFAERFDYETELVVRINRLGKNIPKRFAYRYYDEVTLGIDFTARDLQARSRKDVLGHEVATTFDIRLKKPNREPALTPAISHTLEHLGATYLRNNPTWKSSIIYWGPMGCLTGFYLIVKGNLESRQVLELMRATFEFMADFEGDVPGASPKECGNWTLMDLKGAKAEAKKYLEEVIVCAKARNLEYPDN